MARRILLLGGTTEARLLAQHLTARADLSVILSLAGRTQAPAVQPVPTRSGGFGGAAGLADYLSRESIDLLVDATHPYAARISQNAAEAAALTGTPLLALRRPAWERQSGDRWTEVADSAEAVAALGPSPRRVFLAFGRQEAAAFAVAPQHRYVIRSVDPIEPPLDLPQATYILARGPFDEAAERDLLLCEAIEVIVAKNSGGKATQGKITAARTLGLEVVLLRRPALPDVAAVNSVADAVAWIDQAGTPGAERGV